MPEIGITVTDRIARPDVRDAWAVCGNSDYTITWTLDDEWSAAHIRTAVFAWRDRHTNHSVPVIFEGASCPMPAIPDALVCAVGLWASVDSGEDHILRTTSPAMITMRRSSTADTDRPIITQDVYDELIAAVNAALDAPVQSATEQAQAAASSAADAHTDALAATAAKEGAEAAQTLAGQAAAAAAGAAGAASTAQINAEAAQTAAETAASAASTAKTGAEAAQTAAAASAQAAAGSAGAASTAQINAEAAQTAAETAASAASTAKTGAEAAQTAAAASAQAAAGSAEDAQEVLNSIPEDYSTLSNDVTDLKSATAEITGARVIEFNSGYINTVLAGNTGTLDITPAATFVTGVAQVSGGEIVHITAVGGGGDTGGARAFEILDADLNCIYVTSKAFTANNITYTMPVDAAYVVINNNITSQPNPVAIIGEYPSELIGITNHTITGKDTVFAEKYDDIPWKAGRIRPQSGGIYDAQSINMLRMWDVEPNVYQITAPEKCLTAFIYDPDGTYRGFWVELTHGVSTSATLNKYDVLNIYKIRLYYPQAVICLQCQSTTIGTDATFPSQNFRVVYAATVDVKTQQSSVYTNIPLCDIGWKQGYHVANGSYQNNENRHTTIGYIPSWVMSVTLTSVSWLYAFDSSGNYVGRYGAASSPFTFTSSNGSTEWQRFIDFENLRQRFPEYQFKISVYADMNTLGNAGYWTVDNTARSAEYTAEACYRIPTIVPREMVYTETLELTTTPSMQGMCTDGTYLYYAIVPKAGDNTQPTMLRKIDLNGNLIATNTALIGHANGMTFDRSRNKIVSVGVGVEGRNAEIILIDPETLSITETIDGTDLIGKISAKLGCEMSGYFGQIYACENDTFVIGGGSASALAASDSSNRVLAVVNHDFTAVLKAFVYYVPAGQLCQNIFVDDGYVVVPYNTNILAYYDMSGRLIDKVPYILGLGTGYDELETICKIGDTWYQNWNASGQQMRITKGVPSGFRLIPVGSIDKKYHVT